MKWIHRQQCLLSDNFTLIHMRASCEKIRFLSLIRPLMHNRKFQLPSCRPFSLLNMKKNSLQKEPFLFSSIFYSCFAAGFVPPCADNDSVGTMQTRQRRPKPTRRQSTAQPLCPCPDLSLPAQALGFPPALGKGPHLHRILRPCAEYAQRNL